MEIHFDWRVALSEKARESLQREITALVEGWALAADKPRVVIVSRTTFSPHEEALSLEVRDSSGKPIGTGTGTESRVLKLRRFD